jgi:hypothetical protein
MPVVMLVEDHVHDLTQWRHIFGLDLQRCSDSQFKDKFCALFECLEGYEEVFIREYF